MKKKKPRNITPKAKKATISNLLERAVQYHQAGDLRRAETLYREALKLDPQNSDALNLLGAIAIQEARYEEAVQLIQQAISLNQTRPGFYNNLGLAYWQLGRFAEAVECHQQALRLEPNDAIAYNNLGNALRSLHQVEEAITCYQRAVTLDANYADAYTNLGQLLEEQKQLPQAIACYQQAVMLNPEDVDAYTGLAMIFTDQGQWSQAITCFQQALVLTPQKAWLYTKLGNVFQKQNQLAEATVCYQQALALDPKDYEAYFKLGNLFDKQEQFAEAVACFQRALELYPESVETLINLGNGLMKQGKLMEAIAHYQQALNLAPQSVEAYANLGVALSTQGQLHEAVVCYQKALALNPNSAKIYNNLGNTLNRLDQLTDAVASFQRALELDPLLADAHYNLGNALRSQGRLTEAITCYQRALTLNPSAMTQSALVLTLNCAVDYDGATIFAEHQKFDEHYAKPLASSMTLPGNERSSGRRLKIGYVSPDFRKHSVAYFMAPILAHHNHDQFEIFCYYHDTKIDDMTRRFQQYADHFLPCAELSDEELAARIRTDQIDILIDLAGHTPKHRLLVFARKPAPLQVTYLGYPNTTGLTAIDYRLTDKYVDNQEINEKFNSELPIKLPASFFCYQPYDDTPVVNNLPALDQGYVTFSSFNNYVKVNPPLFELWAEILQALPTAKLVIQTKELQDTGTRQAFQAQMAHWGIAAERLIITPFAPPPEYLKTYHQVDIALDSYPFNGGTTTCEALWMGIPVVTLVGTRQVSRLGLSILSTLGLTELIASSPQEYINICLKLANDLDYLKNLRATMRHRMQTSPLMDASSFTHHLEVIYRQMWERWCVETPPV
jgi:predicted O-linked N-acetylglucosamine transferase (SPINDLY family)